MRVRFEQLTGHLRQRLAPVYLIYGDEPLLVLEAADAVRRAAREQGHEEREVLHVEPGFDWSHLALTSNSACLFTSQRLLELRLGPAKPGDVGGKALREYAKRPADDAVLLITADKLDQNQQKSRWFSELDRVGVVVQVWPVQAHQLPAWIGSRLRHQGLRTTADIAPLLAARVEGNLLAAAQEIDRLALLFGDSLIDEHQLLAVIADSARYSIYDLADAALTGEAERCMRILNGLRAESVEPVLILWALARDVRLLAQIQFDLGRGLSLPAALTRNSVWEKRKPLFMRASERLTVAHGERLLRRCACLDRVVKGVADGNAWDELLDLSVDLAGR